MDEQKLPRLPEPAFPGVVIKRCPRYLFTGNQMQEYGRACYEAALASQPAASAEPVAIVGAGFALFWIGAGPIAPLVQRHGLKVGSLLYAAPAAALAAHKPDSGDAMPSKPGVYAWCAGSANALVLVDRRPSNHSPGGVLNGHVIPSTKFYDGCPVEKWGKDGRWVLLHDFDAAISAQQRQGEGGE